MDCFNSRDGTGLFAGLDRYARLGARASLCAVQAGGNVVRFWGLLLAKMQWPTPPKRADAAVLEAISCAEGVAVLKAIASETASLITLARMLHDADKTARREYHAALRAEMDSPGEATPQAQAEPEFNDQLPM